MSTLEELVQKVVVDLRLESGVSVQQYAEDVIAAKLQRSFNNFFDKYWWPLYTTHGEAMTLNGSTGKVTTDLTEKIKRFQDIHSIWYNTEPKPLTRKPMWVNPAAVTSGLSRYWEPTNNDDDKIFRILPITTTGTIYVTYRTRPDDFIATNEVKIDDDLLTAQVIFDYLVEDAENELAIKKWQQTLNDRERLLREQLNSGPIPFGRAAVSPFTDWMG